ncbi:hypothetical protein THASP1DRAFT_18085 [Thamnocephalis sphaerospora]|uniref:TROVE domain-containing protein n=1 Tax=Thamnocephalis sphaerospora TaxID=78915 RepID=A0A4P9XLM4_9FUNG|nr:hypothetical protein THASP1DRAFT_18085 [Thamnocephalis sphaerospora]|eukprot:RKP06725.1 hypothetical protein THASP1DRAFT_18085 [Thamnocephalis sphaerospora]
MLATVSTSNMTTTENGAATFTSTLSARLDFFFEVMAGCDSGRINVLLSKSWEEDALDTLKLIFQLRDIRDGKGDRKEFYQCLLWLRKHHPETLLANLEQIPGVGYWKDLAELLLICACGQAAYRAFDQAAADRKAVRGRRFQQPLKTLSIDALEEQRRKKRVLAHEAEMERRSEAARSARVENRQERRERVRQLFAEDLFYRRLHTKVALLFASTLQRDLEQLKANKNVTLAAKWAPTPRGNHDKHTLLATTIAELLYPEATYRMADESYIAYVMRVRLLYQRDYLTPLRAKIPVTESLMSRGTWSDIKYNRVPSVCMRNRKGLFEKHDKERFAEFLRLVKAGKAKITSGALMPHELVQEAMNINLKRTFASYDSESADQTENEAEKLSVETMEAQWRSYVTNLAASGVFESSTAVCDVSGSMSGTPMIAAIAFSLLICELTAAPFNQMLITFSEKPLVHLVKGDTLLERVANVAAMDWGGNTDFEAVFNLVLQRAQETKLAPEHMVKRLFVFTDMEFDESHSLGSSSYETSYQRIVAKFTDAGYPVPEMVFWNLRASGRGAAHGASKPATKDQPGVAMLSGFNGQMLKMFLDGRMNAMTPWHTLRAAVDLPKYAKLTVVD